MTNQNFSSMLRRASERVTAGIGAIALTACLLAFSDAKAATAESVYVGPSITVRFERDALTNIQGTEQVYRQIKSAARQVCRLNDGVGTLQQRVVSQKCYAETLENTVRKVDRAQLTSLHQATVASRVG